MLEQIFLKVMDMSRTASLIIVVVCLKEDGTAWTWGTIYIEGGYLSNNVYFIDKPKKF